MLGVHAGSSNRVVISSFGYVHSINDYIFFHSILLKMTYLKSWEEFQRAAERLYLQNPSKVGITPLANKTRYVMKYIHKDGLLILKLTDDVQCLQYKTEIVQDLNKMERFITNLMKHMASKESH